VEVRPIADADRAWVRDECEREWGLPIVSPSGAWDPAVLDGFVAVDGDGLLKGAVAYRIVTGECEVVALFSQEPRRGIGSALLDAVADAAKGCWRLWLITTNDNVHALGFYQRRGWNLVALHRDWIEHVRRLQPAIGNPESDGIPFRHALELELRL